MNRNVGVVVIGRNEGRRLEACLSSATKQTHAVVYVDSGSTDDSVEIAERLGAQVVHLDMTRPFTAARARNEGITVLKRQFPETQFVMVMDGDCQLAKSFVPAAIDVMLEDDRVAVVCGRRRERHPGHSVYNLLCDMEWNTPVGEAEACGGDALIRLQAFERVNGYDDSLIAGEEPELCLRLRRSSWVVQRIDREMTLHDAAIYRFGQWWRRMVRGGYAYAEGYLRYRGAQERFNEKEFASIAIWGFLVPFVFLALAIPSSGLTLLLLVAIYALQAWRTRGHRRRHGDTPRDATMYGVFCMLGKFAQLQGLAQCFWHRLRGGPVHIIEYKDAPPAARKAA